MFFFNTILVLAAAFLAVFFESVLSAPQAWFGARVDLLPALMILAALNTNLLTVALLAIFGGLWFDSLSANPLGITILPLFIVGFPVYWRRDLILRGLPFAQFILGATASALAPLLTVLLLLNAGKHPLLGWGSLWQWLVLTAAGAAATPVLFALFDWSHQALGYKIRTETSFRSDREILRGHK